MRDPERRLSRHNREVMRRRRILETVILIFIVLLGIMIMGLINSGIKAYEIATVSPTPTPTMFPRITATPLPTVFVTPTPGPVVMIDPGHGGNDVGSTANNKADVYEKEINLNIGLKVKEKLERLGFTVLMTRETDVWVDLEERKEMYDRSEATAFVSIHLNEAPKDALTSEGGEVYYNPQKNEQSQTLAEFIVNEISEKTGMRNRGVKENDYYVLLTSKVAVLAECGFMTSEEQYALLKTDSYRELIAEGIVDGLVKYYKKLNGAKKQNE